MRAMEAGSDVNGLELCNKIQFLAEMLPDVVESWFCWHPCSSSMIEKIVRKFFIVLGLLYNFFRHCMLQL